MLPRSPVLPAVSEKLRRLPSLRELVPKSVLASMPSKPLRRMKLTTPPIASEPYTAEAPSLSTSTRSIIVAGIALTSLLARRVPLTRISVRLSPRPRSEMVEAPVPPPLLVLGLVALPAIDGSSCTRSPSVALPVASICARLIVTTGLAVSVSTRRRREPVTTMLSRVWGLPSSALASCASAGHAAPSDSAATTASASGCGRWEGWDACGNDMEIS